MNTLFESNMDMEQPELFKHQIARENVLDWSPQHTLTDYQLYYDIKTDRGTGRLEIRVFPNGATYDIEPYYWDNQKLRGIWLIGQYINPLYNAVNQTDEYIDGLIEELRWNEYLNLPEDLLSFITEQLHSYFTYQRIERDTA